MKTLLLVLIFLVVWKTVRTDWLVTCPWYTDCSIQSPGTENGYHDALHRPPVSPAWDPPRPVENNHQPQTWKHVGESSGASFAVGEPKLRPDWALMRLKIGAPLLLVLSLQTLRKLHGHRQIVVNLARELITESRRQHGR